VDFARIGAIAVRHSLSRLKVRAEAMPELTDEEFFRLRARNLALSKIMSETRVGEVEGIRFDLRHSEVKTDDWTINILGRDDGYPPRRTPTLPFIWFTWYGKFDIVKLKADVKEKLLESDKYNEAVPPTPRWAFDNITDDEYAEVLTAEEKWRRKRIGPAEIKKEVADRTPDAIVNPGDCVSVHHVVMNISDDEFIPIHDRGEVQLFLKITNEAGLYEVIETPVVMHGATRLTYRYGNKAIYSIIERVRRRHGLAKITQASAKNVPDNHEEYGYSRSALYRAVNLCEDYLPRSWKWEHSESRRRARIGMKFIEALDDACMLGYAWAYAEAAERMRPLAVAALASRAGASRAGQASGARRRAKAADTWQGLVKGEASKIRAEKPRVSQAKLAEEIKFKLDDAVPSHPIIVRHIAKLERDNKLPKTK
jgi:hypothetical protein